jgi:hypothetical protein
VWNAPFPASLGQAAWPGTRNGGAKSPAAGEVIEAALADTRAADLVAAQQPETSFDAEANCRETMRHRALSRSAGHFAAQRLRVS